MEEARNKPRVEEQVNHLPIRPNRIETMIALQQSEMRWILYALTIFSVFALD